MTALALAAALLLSPAHAGKGDKAALPTCREDGKTAQIDGKLHTCGECPRGEGTLSVWAPGKHAASAMNSACKDAADSVSHSIRVKIVAPPERKY